MNRLAQRGFTLMELMITLVVIGIIVSIAYPNYAESVRKNNRATAKALMTEVAQRLQQFYSEGSGAATYTTTLTDLNYPSGTLYSESKGHTITVSAGAAGIASSYIITATPVNTDTKCGNLTLNHLGVYSPSGC